MKKAVFVLLWLVVFSFSIGCGLLSEYLRVLLWRFMGWL
jgi:hypothetical protein